MPCPTGPPFHGIGSSTRKGRSAGGSPAPAPWFNACCSSARAFGSPDADESTSIGLAGLDEFLRLSRLHVRLLRHADRLGNRDLAGAPLGARTPWNRPPGRRAPRNIRPHRV